MAEWDTTDHRKRPTPPRPKWEGAGPEPPKPPHRWWIEQLANQDNLTEAVHGKFGEQWREDKPHMQFVDRRPVPPTKRLNDRIPIDMLDRTVEGALSAGLDPKLALAMQLQEGHFWPATNNMAFYEALNVLGHAARVPNASRERQIQAFNGLGTPRNKTRPMYGGQDPRALPENFYGKRVGEVERDVIAQTPEVDASIERVKAAPYRALSMAALQAMGDPNYGWNLRGPGVVDTLHTISRYPNLLK